MPVSLSHEKELKLGKLLLRFPEVITRYGSSYSGSQRSLPGMEAPTQVPRGHYQVWKLLLWFPEVITRYGSSYSGSQRSLPGMEATGTSYL